MILYGQVYLVRAGNEHQCIFCHEIINPGDLQYRASGNKSKKKRERKFFTNYYHFLCFYQHGFEADLKGRKTVMRPGKRKVKHEEEGRKDYMTATRRAQMNKRNYLLRAIDNTDDPTKLNKYIKEWKGLPGFDVDPTKNMRRSPETKQRLEQKINGYPYQEELK